MTITLTPSYVVSATLTPSDLGAFSILPAPGNTLTLTPNYSNNGNIEIAEVDQNLLTLSPALSGVGRAIVLNSLPEATRLILSPFYKGDPGDGSGSFLPVPDEIDVDPVSSYTYYGWLLVAGGWLVRRTLRSTAIANDATQASNPAYSNLATAWAARVTLNYA